MSEERGPVIPCGCGCGTMIQEFDNFGRQRHYAHGHYMNTLWRSIKAAAEKKAAAK